MIIYIKGNLALARIEKKKTDLQLSSTSNATATKNFTNFTTINQVCELLVVEKK